MSHERHDEGTHGGVSESRTEHHDPEQHEHHAPAAPREGRAGRFGRFSRLLTRETRFGLAAVLSFVIFVSVMIVNKRTHHLGSGKTPPVNEIGAGGQAGATSPSENKPEKLVEKPKKPKKPAETDPPANDSKLANAKGSPSDSGEVPTPVAKGGGKPADAVADSEGTGKSEKPEVAAASHELDLPPAPVAETPKLPDGTPVASASEGDAAASPAPAEDPQTTAQTSSPAADSSPLPTPATSSGTTASSENAGPVAATTPGVPSEPPSAEAALPPMAAAAEALASPAEKEKASETVEPPPEKAPLPSAAPGEHEDHPAPSNSPDKPAEPPSPPSMTEPPKTAPPLPTETEPARSTPPKGETPEPQPTGPSTADASAAPPAMPAASTEVSIPSGDHPEPKPEQAEPAPATAPTPSPGTTPASPPPGSPPKESGDWIDIPSAGPAGVRSAPTQRGSARRVVEPAVIAAVPAAVDEQPEPVYHVVQSGENFWTISRLYYNSGRFYKALWKANSRIVERPDKLYVNTRLRIPPPEELDRSLVEPPSLPSRRGETSSRESDVPVHRTSRPVLSDNRNENDRTPRGGPPTESEVVLPNADPLAPSEKEDRPRHSSLIRRDHLIVYKVRPHETLRSIARETLGDSHRADEILELNREVIDNPRQLIPGQLLELPEDAQLSRRKR